MEDQMPRNSALNFFPVFSTVPKFLAVTRELVLSSRACFHPYITEIVPLPKEKMDPVESLQLRLCEVSNVPFVFGTFASIEGFESAENYALSRALIFTHPVKETPTRPRARDVRDPWHRRRDFQIG